MRWPRPRFTVRRLIMAIAILAIGFGGISWVAKMRVRSAAYRRRALEFEWQISPRAGSMVRTADGRLVDRYENENHWLEEDWAWRMEAKYLHLSYYPWLAAEPDPHPPQPLDDPRSALDLPKRDYSLATSVHALRPPAWTFLWTWEWH